MDPTSASSRSGARPAARPAGFPRSRRLRKPHEYRRMERQGTKVHGALLVVVIRGVRPGAGRVGLTVSKKVGGAVVRNRVKRRLREIVRRDLARIDALELVVIAREAAATAPFAMLADALWTGVARAQQELSRRPRSHGNRGGRGRRDPARSRDG